MLSNLCSTPPHQSSMASLTTSSRYLLLNPSAPELTPGLVTDPLRRGLEIEDTESGFSSLEISKTLKFLSFMNQLESDFFSSENLVILCVNRRDEQNGMFNKKK